MAVFTISDNTIDVIKKKRLLAVVLTVIISLIIWGSLSFFVIKSIMDIKILIISFCISIIVVSLTVYFSLKSSLKILTKEMKSIQYIIDDEKIIIKKNNIEQFNISKKEIKCINKYKNNIIIIILNTNKKITINRYLDNIEQLIENLNILSPVNKINKNPSIIKNIGISILQLIVVSTLLLSNNIILVAVSGLIVIIYSIVNYYDESIDKKRRKLLLVCAIIIVVLKIVRILL